ncbi:MAG TPA: phenylalanine--tRNA ligase subunit beta [Bacteroidota bacterium]|nr:phenylalanine--tRNA ligase subunit beta [Bacteroidota bacterium]
MRILERWLRQYIDFDIPPAELAERLTMLGLEFESVRRLDEAYNGFVVGEVLAKEKHPKADRLSVCTVGIGRETLQIVCGGPNVAQGQKVPVGLIGATVPRNQHDPSGGPFVLSRVTIRGVESSGMICSEYELHMGSDADGIMVLDRDAKPGEPLAAYFGLDDVAFDLEITPNRPDWLSHIGVAREIAILTRTGVRMPAVKLKESAEPVGKHLSVTVEDAGLCPRFAARMITGVTIGPSPRWLQNALRNAGLRPRNNVVDITNYVMYECGQPLHAFDHALLKGGAIRVRAARGGTRFTTLDGHEHALPEGTVMVCDAEREVSIAGVMGGANSEIGDSTRDVVLEAACWNPASIRRTARSLGISTDASMRFERGADPNGVRFALDRAAQLVVELARGTLLKGCLDVYPKKIRERSVPLRFSRVNRILGTKLKKPEIIADLALIGITQSSAGTDASKFRVPTYRVDVEREIDLIEEVARVHGYDRIAPGESASVSTSQQFPISSPRDGVRSALIGRGYHEAITNSMLSLKRARLGGSTPVEIGNPQNQEMGALRTGLLAGLLEVVARNQNAGNPDLRLFEIGRVFSVDETGTPHAVENFLEREMVCLVLTGSSAPVHWSSPKREADLFDIKGDIEFLLAKFALDKSRFISYSTSNGLTERPLAIEIQGSNAGYLGPVRGDVLAEFRIERPVFAAELDIAVLGTSAPRVYVPLPRFPRVRRDVAFTVDAGIPAEDLERTLRDSASELLRSVDVFDVYEGEQLPGGKKSIAFTLEFMSLEKTLTDAEIETEVGRVVAGVGKAHGAVLRSMR